MGGPAGPLQAAAVSLCQRPFVTKARDSLSLCQRPFVTNARDSLSVCQRLFVTVRAQEGFPEGRRLSLWVADIETGQARKILGHPDFYLQTVLDT